MFSNLPELCNIRGMRAEMIQYCWGFDIERIIIWYRPDGTVFETYKFNPVKMTEEQIYKELQALREEMLWKL